MMPTELIDAFVKYGLSVNFLVGLIVAGLCTAVVILWKDSKAKDVAYAEAIEKLRATWVSEKDALQLRLESVQEKRVQESKDRNKALVDLTEDNVKAMGEVVSTVSSLKDAILFQDRERGK